MRHLKLIINQKVDKKLEWNESGKSEEYWLNRCCKSKITRCRVLELWFCDVSQHLIERLLYFSISDGALYRRGKRNEEKTHACCCRSSCALGTEKVLGMHVTRHTTDKSEYLLQVLPFRCSLDSALPFRHNQIPNTWLSHLRHSH